MVVFTLFVFRLFITLFVVAFVDFFDFRLPFAVVAAVFVSDSAVLWFKVMLSLLLFVKMQLVDA